MEFRRTVEKDIDNIMMIIGQAQAYLKDQGVDQWQDGYPNREVIKSDINYGYSYAFLENNQLIGTAAVSFDIEESYKVIHEGKWITEGDYAVIHRIAVEKNCKGLGMAASMIHHIEQLCLEKGVTSIKIDTHEDNLSMQKMLGKNNFKYCGVIYLEDGSKRLAYEKVLA